MDKKMKKVLKYFMDNGKGRGKSIRADILMSNIVIKEKDISDVLGSCMSRKYLDVLVDSRDSKFNHYYLTSEGMKAMDDQTNYDKNFRYVKASLVLIVCGIVVTILVGLQNLLF